MRKMPLVLAIVFMCSFVYAADYDLKASTKGEPADEVREGQAGELEPLDMGEPTSEEESQMERDKHSEEMFDNDEPQLGYPEEGSTEWEQDF